MGCGVGVAVRGRDLVGAAAVMRRAAWWLDPPWLVRYLVQLLTPLVLVWLAIGPDWRALARGLRAWLRRVLGV